MNALGHNKDVLEKIKEGYQNGLFEPAILGENYENQTSLSRLNQMAFLYKANQRYADIFNSKASLFIPNNGVFNFSTIQAMNQVGLRMISGQENIQVINDRILPSVVDNLKRANYTKIYNIPQTVNLSRQNDSFWMTESTEGIIAEIRKSIERYGYAVVAIYPEDFAETHQGKLMQAKQTGQLKKLDRLLDKITSKKITIGNFESITGIIKSPYYELRTPRPVITDSNLTAEVVYDGLNFPTKMEFLSDNDILVLEKNDGTVKRIVNGSLKNVILDLPVSTKGERGLLGIAIAEDNQEYPYVFLYYTYAQTDGSDISANEDDTNVENLLVRYELKDTKLINPKKILRLPEKSTWAHNGGAMTIGPDNNLYLVIGDQVISDTMAQNTYNGSLPVGNGGILRFLLDGNPVGKGILGSQLPLSLYYAYGIRNSFGVAFDPISNNLWDTENGPQGGDEINLVKPGFNSGWKKVQGVYNKTGTISQNTSNLEMSKLVDFNGSGTYREPELTWAFPAGPTGISFLNSSKLGIKYNSSVFIGDFHNGYLYNFNLTGDREHLVLNTKHERKILNKTDLSEYVFGKGFGGIVDLKEGPDGNLYVLSTHAGDADCLTLSNHCVPYESPVGGTIFRIRVMK